MGAFWDSNNIPWGTAYGLMPRVPALRCREPSRNQPRQLGVPQWLELDIGCLKNGSSIPIAGNRDAAMFEDVSGIRWRHWNPPTPRHLASLAAWVTCHPFRHMSHAVKVSLASLLEATIRSRRFNKEPLLNSFKGQISEPGNSYSQKRVDPQLIWLVSIL